MQVGSRDTWEMPHGWELILTEWYRRFVWFALYFLQGTFLC